MFNKKGITAIPLHPEVWSSLAVLIMDITRIPELSDEHFSLLKRYHKAYGILTKDFTIYND